MGILRISFLLLSFCLISTAFAQLQGSGGGPDGIDYDPKKEQHYFNEACRQTLARIEAQFQWCGLGMIEIKSFRQFMDEIAKLSILSFSKQGSPFEQVKPLCFAPDKAPLAKDDWHCLMSPMIAFDLKSLLVYPDRLKVYLMSVEKYSEEEVDIVIKNLNMMVENARGNQ
jgi:hypothetical protein